MQPRSASDVGAVPVQKQRFNVYTMMLVLSFIAITTGCILLWAELSTYMEEGSTCPPWNTSAARVTAPAQ